MTWNCPLGRDHPSDAGRVDDPLQVAHDFR